MRTAPATGCASGWVSVAKFFTTKAGSRLSRWVSAFLDIRNWARTSRRAQNVSATGMIVCSPPCGDFELVLAIGSYAQHYHLNERARKSVTETVRAWREYVPFAIPLPHPSWHNNHWLKQNPWFHSELVPYLRARVAQVLSSES